MIRAARSAVASLTALQGKICLVVGASGDLGRGAALGVAACGATVVVAGRNAERCEAVTAAVRNVGTTAISQTVDVTNRTSVKELFATVKRELGRLDVLIYSAGTNARSPAQGLEQHEWASVIETNLTGAFYCSQEAFGLMEPRGRGRIIYISSAAGLVARATPTTSAYGASKAGLIHLTRYLAAEWAPYGLTVNSLAPGYFKTELTRPLWSDEAKLAKLLELTPMARLGEMTEFIGPLIFLASDASSFITGHTLSVDGGRAIL